MVGQRQKIAVIPVIDLTLRATLRFFPLFLGLAIVAYAVATTAAMVARTTTLEFRSADAERYAIAAQHLLIWSCRFPIVVSKFLVAGLIAHRTWNWLMRITPSLRADAGAAERAFWTLVGLALLWHALTALPLIPDGLRRLTLPSDWYDDVTWIPETVRAYFYYYSAVRPLLTLGGVILVVLGLRWSLAIPATLIEGLGPVAALRRSAALTQDNRLRVLSLWLIVGASGLAINELFGLIETYGLGADWRLPPYQLSRTSQWVMSLIVMAVGTTAIYAQARRIEEATSPTDATAPAPTAAP